MADSNADVVVTLSVVDPLRALPDCSPGDGLGSSPRRGLETARWLLPSAYSDAASTAGFNSTLTVKGLR
jgi:hypothetical protein